MVKGIDSTQASGVQGFVASFTETLSWLLSSIPEIVLFLPRLAGRTIKHVDERDSKTATLGREMVEIKRPGISKEWSISELDGRGTEYLDLINDPIIDFNGLLSTDELTSDEEARLKHYQENSHLIQLIDLKGISPQSEEKLREQFPYAAFIKG
jgi:hypothetical protein